MADENILDRLKQLEGRMDAMERPALQGPPIDQTIPSAPEDAWSAGGGLMQLPDWLPAALETEDGIVVDPGRARSPEPCLRIELGGGRQSLVYKHGVIGALSAEQQTLYCQDGFADRHPSERQVQRISTLADAAKSCSTAAQDSPTVRGKLDAYFSCLSEELHSKDMTP